MNRSVNKQIVSISSRPSSPTLLCVAYLYLLTHTLSLFIHMCYTYLSVEELRAGKGLLNLIRSLYIFSPFLTHLCKIYGCTIETVKKRCCQELLTVCSSRPSSPIMYNILSISARMKHEEINQGSFILHSQIWSQVRACETGVKGSSLMAPS